ncbi:hypothetical protein ACFFGT_10035 [Mucilaginibacter angelicae]|uniref:Uncharacterized protein n=1 Tax=Mucilaginibacter angelicae TaxID=869718 RepID=A0ABV6L520_9SPHI
MKKRYMTIVFRHLPTDGLLLRRGELQELPFVIAAQVKNRVIITASSPAAEQQGDFAGMARAAVPELLAIDDIPGRAAKLLRLIGLWCIRYTPAGRPDPRYFKLRPSLGQRAGLSEGNYFEITQRGL